MSKFAKKEITKKSDNISEWYNDVVLKAELADYGPVKGTMVIRPYGYALWERVQEIFNPMMREKGVQNAYFPLFIPQSLLEKEKEHVEGFSPELAVVTIAGGEKLKDPLVVRPTSETIMYSMYSDWIQSWRDLPVLINQWNNVVRWEKRTYLFLRTTEFLWQEGHTAHEDEAGAIDMAETALEWYRSIYEDYYAIPVYLGIKSTAEKFAGAKTTYSLEALMPDGKVLQGATSHNLGQNFSKPFNISFQNRTGKNDYAWQTSWGLSTRSLGGMFLTHGDDDGLVLPPKIAPIKMVILPILGKDDQKVLNFSKKIKEEVEKGLKGTEYEGRVEIWDNPEKTLGWKLSETELKGIPIEATVGLKEVEENGVVLATRLILDTEDGGIKHRQVRLEEIGKNVLELLESLQRHLYKIASRYLEENTHEATTYEEFKEIMNTKRGFIKAFWCEDAECEKEIKDETKASTRILPLDARQETGVCVRCGKEAKGRWLFGQAY
ncbi:MAG: proline--tRNA ligase [Candidatus Levybacteria bacterium]|nr:proline--tRNA ligase [Candidatus Levybacteria bacterium]